MAITATQRDRLNNDFHPTAQEVDLGDAVIAAPVVMRITVDADARDPEGTPATGTVPCDMRVVDAFVECTDNASSGTLKVRDSAGDDITSTMAVTTDKTLARATTIDHAKATLSKGDVIDVEGSAAASEGIVTIIGVRV